MENGNTYISDSCVNKFGASSSDCCPLPCSNDENSEDLNYSYESELLSLHNAFKEFYQKRMSFLKNAPDDCINNKQKLHALMDYIEQLEEQNDMLVSTMIELEKEAEKRVLQMEKRLKSSAKATMESVVNFNQCEEDIHRLVNDRVEMETLIENMQQKISLAEVENGFLRDQNFNLNHDIQALLHVIHHSRSTGHWEMDCVTFCEVTPEQVFGPVQSHSNLFSNDSDVMVQNHVPKGVCNCSSKGLEVETKSNSATHNCELLSYQSPHFSRSTLQRSISLPSFLHSTTSSSNKICKDKFSSSKSSFGISPKKTVLSRRALELKIENANKTSPQMDSKASTLSALHQAYSEPHLFLFGDSIYVYKPCEPLCKEVSTAFKEDQKSLLPCQSIDFKFPNYDATCGLKCMSDILLNHKGASLLDFTNMPCSDGRFSKSSCSTPGSHSCRNSKHSCNSSSESLSCARCSQTHPCTYAPKNSVTSYGMQTDNVEFISVGLQTSDHVEKNLLNGTFAQQGSQEYRNCEVPAQKGNVNKIDDQVLAQSILVKELQSHLNTITKEVELKDTVVENMEKKLNSSRNEVKALKEEIVDFEEEIKELHQQVTSCKEENYSLRTKLENQEKKLKYMALEEQELHNQKRNLMTQLDVQGDELECTKLKLEDSDQKLKSYIIQIEQLNEIIKSLQDALVQTKRTLDKAKPVIQPVIHPDRLIPTQSLRSSRGQIMEL